MYEVPIFLYTLFYVLVASMIPILLLSLCLRMIIKSGKKTYRSVKS